MSKGDIVEYIAIIDVKGIHMTKEEPVDMVAG